MKVEGGGVGMSVRNAKKSDARVTAEGIGILRGHPPKFLQSLFSHPTFSTYFMIHSPLLLTIKKLYEHLKMSCTKSSGDPAILCGRRIDMFL